MKRTTVYVSPIRTKGFRLSYSIIKLQTSLKFSCPVSHLITVQRDLKTIKKHRKKRSRKLNNRGRQGHAESVHIPKYKMQTWKCFCSGYEDLTQLNIWLFQSSGKAFTWILPQPAPLWPQSTANLSAVSFAPAHLHVQHPNHAAHHRGRAVPSLPAQRDVTAASPTLLGETHYSRW